jgi:hypothetical protein
VNVEKHTRRNINALSRIRTHGISVQAIKAYTSGHVAIGTGLSCVEIQGDQNKTAQILKNLLK